MFRSLTIAALVATLGATPLVALAQTAPANAPAPTADSAAPPTHHRMGRIARALRDLDLTPDQRAKIRSANREYKASRSTATPETRAQLRANLEAILTPDQRGRFEATMRAHAPAPAPAPVASPA